MPNIRRFVMKGDWIFVISGKVPGAQQYVVGGLRVAEKIDALSAYVRFPENRLAKGINGEIMGNVIVSANGKKHPLDTHPASTFENRIKNFIVGDKSIALSKPEEVRSGREQTLSKLAEIIGKPGANRVIDTVGRCSRLNEPQINQLITWLSDIKSAH